MEGFTNEMGSDKTTKKEGEGIGWGKDRRLLGLCLAQKFLLGVPCENG